MGKFLFLESQEGKNRCEFRNEKHINLAQFHYGHNPRKKSSFFFGLDWTEELAFRFRIFVDFIISFDKILQITKGLFL